MGAADARSSYTLALHAGAGNRSHSAEKATRRLLREALLGVAERLPSEASAVDVVTAAVSILEDSPITNAGVGSCLTLDGTVECDAAVCSVDSVGAVGAVVGVKNPVWLAGMVREAAARRGPLGLVNPCVMTGAGAQQFAVQCGASLQADCHRTEATQQTWRKYRDGLGRCPLLDSATDTVGAVALDVRGNLAAAASSGGNWLKPPGRLGAAAIPNAGLAVAGDCAVAASGIGELIIRDSLALRVALDVERGGGGSLRQLAESCRAGFICLRRTGQRRAEVLFGHAVPSLCYGFYCPSSMAKPVCVASSGAAGAYVSGAHRIH